MTAEGGTKPISEWSVEEVGQWLVAIGLGAKVDVFASNAVSGDMLLELEEEDLKGDLTLTSLQIKKLQKSLEFSKSLEDGGADAGSGSNDEDAAKVRELEEELSKLKMDLSAAEEKNKGLEEELQKLKAPVEKSDPPPPPPTKPAPSQQQQQQGRPVVAGAAGGAARGAVMGAVAGAIVGDAGQGAKIGAATGATGGALRGLGARRGRRRAFG